MLNVLKQKQSMLPKGENTGDVRASGKVLCMGLRTGKCEGWAWMEIDV